MKKLLWSLLFVCLEVSLAQPTLTTIQSLPELLGVDNPRFPLLSPDGQIIFYEQDNSLCLFGIDKTETQCYPYPETFGGMGRFSSPVWSPDSSRVIFTESFFDMFRESDVWQFGRTGTYTNLTDDGVKRFRLGDEDPNALIDYLPTFSPSGELYFFRSRPTSGINEVLGTRFSLELFTLLGTGEAKRVSSLRPQLPVLSVYLPAPISPDGQRIALIVAGPQYLEDTTTGVWVQDLATGQREQILKLSHLPETRPGEPQDEPFIPRQLEWAGNQALIINTEDYTFSSPPMTRNSFYIALGSKEITPFENFSALGPADLYKEDDAKNPVYRLPLSGFVTPDAKHYIYLGGFNTEYFLWSRSLPLKDEPAKLLGTLSPSRDDNETPPIISGGFDTPASSSSDGKRALILGYLLTLE